MGTVFFLLWSFFLPHVVVSAEEETEAEPDVRSIVISYAGDVTLGSYKGQSGYLFGNYYNDYGDTYFFNNVRELFQKDDLTFVNLEGPLTNETQKLVKTFSMKGEPAYANILKDGSIEVCNLSNNHIYDCGYLGFQETVNTLLVNGIGCCGEGIVYRQNIKGINVSFLGYQGWKADEELRSRLEADIQAERQMYNAALVIVMFHYGTERMYTSNSTQETISHWAIDYGADVVVGAHPHVIQGIETYNGRNIYYSLGNFCFGANKNPTDQDSMIVQEVYTFVDGALAKIDTNVVPCKLSSDSKKNNFQPIPATGTEYIRIINKLIGNSGKYEDSVFG